jgi:serine/threonine protein kinase
MSNPIGNELGFPTKIEGNNTLEELAKGFVYREAEIWQLLKEILPQIKLSHARQILHRDIKPDNIVRRADNGQLVLVGWDFAVPIDRVDTIVGTPESD